MGKDFETKIKMSVLQNVANYYEFPIAVFFGANYSKKTRIGELEKIKDKFDRIKDIVEE